MRSENWIVTCREHGRRWVFPADRWDIDYQMVTITSERHSPENERVLYASPCLCGEGLDEEMRYRRMLWRGYPDEEDDR